MGTIWIREFTGGLDTRRMPETTPGSALVVANNGHVTRGGEFEKRAAFVPLDNLPAGTFGLAATNASLYVFGHAAAPGGLPSGVLYQRLQHPSGTAMQKILSYDLYAGKLYVVAQYTNGDIYHFYDGNRVTDWFDGRAYATFRVASGHTTAAVKATGMFEIIAGTNDVANTITAVTINGVNLIASPVQHTGNNYTTASAVASAINSHTSSPDYTAYANGQNVVIEAAVAGTTPNGLGITTTVTGDFTTDNEGVMSGGVAATASTLSDIKVDGVSIIDTPIAFTTSEEQMATDIAAEINSYTSTPEYEAVASSVYVTIRAAAGGVAANGRTVVFTVANGLVLDPASGPVMAGGADSSTSYQPGRFVKTIGKKMHSTSESILHFSGIEQPTKWTTSNVGAGFIDLSTESSGAESLMAIAKYLSLIAVFAENVIQTWFVDPDPSLYRLTQVLNNTGTPSPRSVTPFGDEDVFYLALSGCRSLQARDSSNAAATADLGVPIDALVQAKLQSLSVDERKDNVVGVIEPGSGRFWLAMKDTIFVFSLFPGSKVSAWSTYTPEYVVAGVDTAFNVEFMIAFQGRVYIRSGNKIFAYGGTGSSVTYDTTECEVYLPFLDGDDPTRAKTWSGFDAALTGLWEISAVMGPLSEDYADADAEVVVANLHRTTFNEGRVPMPGESTHISLRARTREASAAKLSSMVAHYVGDADEDKGP